MEGHQNAASSNLGLAWIISAGSFLGPSCSRLHTFYTASKKANPGLFDTYERLVP